MHTKQTIVVTGLVVGALVFGCSTARDESDGALGSTTSALSADQCDYFAVGGKTRICHATGSAKHPYVILNLSEAACIGAHAGHPADYVAVGDATCNGQGCLPEGAPSDPTLACCEGLSSRNGTCQRTDRCIGVVCNAADQCHASSCDSATGQCVDTAKVDGFPCDDGTACTQTDTCQAGTCTGANPVLCAPGDQCHNTGICNPATGLCSNPPAADSTACDDGDACTKTDVCTGGTCTGSPVVCLAQDACHGTGTCNPQNGKCTNPVLGFGTVCAANSMCNAGACACNYGWADCNGNPIDGCETNLSTSSSCGACGVACGGPNSAIAQCSGGSCSIWTCQAGWGDCNGGAVDGCETNLQQDPNHCGACGLSCGNGLTCLNGQCTAP